jgi:chromosome partitioning protein
MPIVIAFVSQKGGVGKSTLARALACASLSAGLTTRLVDLDEQQRTLVLWEKARRQNRLAPAVSVAAYDAGENFDRAAAGEIIILDTPGRVRISTLPVVRQAHLVVQPTGPSRDDLFPGVLVFQAMVNLGIPHERLKFALCRTLNRSEEEAARACLWAAGFSVLPGAIPEKVAYRKALDRGQSPTETPEMTLDKRSDALMQALLMQIDTLLRQSIGRPPGLSGGRQERG